MQTVKVARDIFLSFFFHQTARTLEQNNPNSQPSLKHGDPDKSLEHCLNL